MYRDSLTGGEEGDLSWLRFIVLPGSVEEPLETLSGDAVGLFRPGIFELLDLEVVGSMVGGMGWPLLARVLSGLISFFCGVKCTDLSAPPSLLLLALLALLCLL
jgi:hypothetical protein